MFNIVAPTEFVLTLQSVPPFVVESIFALALAMLLAIPLIAQIQLFLDGPLKCSPRNSSSRRSFYETDLGCDRIYRPVLMHYPAAPISLNSTSSSSINVDLKLARKTFSTPLLQTSDEEFQKQENTRENSSKKDNRVQPKVIEPITLKHSSSYLQTRTDVPIVDISPFNYNLYRHKLIEATLKKHYDDYQPPGDVVMNSIQLNSADSTVQLSLDDKCRHNLFDFLEERRDVTKNLSKKETEYLHPLDHFRVKGAQKIETGEKATETSPIHRTTSETLDQQIKDQNPIYLEGSKFRNRTPDNTGNFSRMTIQSKNEIPSVDIRMPRAAKNHFRKAKTWVKEATTTQLYRRFDLRNPSSKTTINPQSSRLIDSRRPRTPNIRPPSAGCSGTLGLTSSVVQRENAIERLKLPKSSDGKRSAESFSSRKAIDSESKRHVEDSSALLSIDKEEKEFANYTSASSSEIASVYSEASKLRNDNRSRSRESSNPSKSRSSTPSRAWPVDSAQVSCRRKYENSTKDSVKNQETGSEGRYLPPKRHTIIGDKSSELSSTLKTSNPVSRPRSANCSFLRKRRTDKVSQRENPAERVKTDTENPFANSDTINDLSRKSFHKRRLSLDAGSRVNESQEAAVAGATNISDKSSVATEKLVDCNEKREDFDSSVSSSTFAKKAILKRTSLPSSLPRLLKNLKSDVVGAAKAECPASHDELRRKSEQKSRKLIQSRSQRPRTASGALSKGGILSPKLELSAELLNPIDGPPKSKLMSKAVSPDKSVEKARIAHVNKERTNKKRLAGGASYDMCSTDFDWRVTDYSDRDFCEVEPYENNLNRSRPGFCNFNDFQAKEKSSSPTGKRFSRSKSASNKRITRNKVKKSIVKEIMDEKKSIEEQIRLPRRGSKADLAMQAGLISYIKKLKRILVDGCDVRAIDLASMSLSEAILPDIESVLSLNEIQELRNVLNLAERKSHLIL